MGTICFLIQLPSFQVDILIKMLDGMENTPSYSGISVKEMQQKIIIKVISGGGGKCHHKKLPTFSQDRLSLRTEALKSHWHF